MAIRASVPSNIAIVVLALSWASRSSGLAVRQAAPAHETCGASCQEVNRTAASGPLDINPDRVCLCSPQMTMAPNDVTKSIWSRLVPLHWRYGMWGASAWAEKCTVRHDNCLAGCPEGLNMDFMCFHSLLLLHEAMHTIRACVMYSYTLCTMKLQTSVTWSCIQVKTLNTT